MSVGGKAADKGLQVLARSDRAGRVIGIADIYQSGRRPGTGKHAVKIMRETVIKRYGYDFRAQRFGVILRGFERRPRLYHLPAVAEKRAGSHSEYFRGPASKQHLLRFHLVKSGNPV